jgi:hypothetical protein
MFAILGQIYLDRILCRIGLENLEPVVGDKGGRLFQPVDNSRLTVPANAERAFFGLNRTKRDGIRRLVRFAYREIGIVDIEKNVADGLNLDAQIRANREVW